MKKKIFASALFLLLGIPMFACSPSPISGDKEQTEPTIRLTPGLSHFKALECDVPATVIYTQGANYDLVIETPIKYEKHLRYMVDGDGCLEIDATKERVKNWKGITIHITAPQLDKVDLNGAVKFSTKGEIALDRMSIEVEGASSVFLPAVACKNFDLEINGAGKAEANITKAQRVGIEGNGASKVVLNAESELINIDGEGTCSFDITAKGKNVVTDLSGVCKMTLTTDS